ncbi:hypothetical protein Psuf_065310 [Phytohabitans suffuscus]|uniref:Phytanoyl-CoA dioxygenase n=1 Tax=Phytohabitans suffuscus TaxID=624315 RepID=A0A6F8YTF5_9ACTN|nr:hypothetical protein Psuf_065310 [Phytohabitans suffuscus]
MREEIKVAESVNETATLGLTAEQVEFFKENGFVGPFDLYSEDEAPLVWSQAMIDMVKSKNKPHSSTIINYDRHLDCNTLSEHIAHPKIVHKLRSLMGDDIICWKTNIFEKQPNESGTGWHQVEAFIVYESETVAYPSLRYTEETREATQELTVWTAFSPRAGSTAASVSSPAATSSGTTTRRSRWDAPWRASRTTSSATTTPSSSSTRTGIRTRAKSSRWR